MARAAQVCIEHGCPNLQPCPAHARKPWSGSDRRADLPADWRARRSAVLARDKGVCQLRHPGCTHRAIEVHHTVSRTIHDLEALIATCPSCHKVETQREAANARRGGGVGGPTPGRPPHR
jgi:hypothetical protein